MQIVIQDLSKIYSGNIVALKHIDLSIGTGMFGLLGPNGAGKTTLMRILATLVRPTKGAAWIGGYRTDDPKEKWVVKAMLGYLPQELAFYGDLSAYEFLEYVTALKRIHWHVRKRQIQEALEVVGLAGVAKRRIKTYSGGMKRRLGIAQALIGNPSVLIIDEPTVGLDPQERVRFRNLLVALGHNSTIILSTHIIDDIAQTCPKLAILHQGSVIFSGNTGDLIDLVRGKVWEVEATDYRPGSGTIVVGSMQDKEEATYRLLAPAVPHSSARPLQPTLEDAYLWSIHQLGVSDTATTAAKAASDTGASGIL